MAEKIEIGLPDELELSHRGSHLEIVRKWFRWYILYFTVFAIIWDGGLFFKYPVWYSEAVQSGDLKVALFPLFHVAVGIGLTYFVVAYWFNRTYISVGLGKISVRHRPIPWYGNKELEVSNIKQLYAKEGRPESDAVNSPTYEVHAINHDGRNTKLVGDLDTNEQALYIEQEIEKYLGIKDVPIKGEIVIGEI